MQGSAVRGARPVSAVLAATLAATVAEGDSGSGERLAAGAKVALGAGAGLLAGAVIGYAVGGVIDDVRRVPVR